MECAAKGRGSPCFLGPPTRRCGLCGAVAYCSPSHQVSHWSDHKDECARFEKQMKNLEFLNDFPFTFSLETTCQEFGQKTMSCNFLTSSDLHLKGLWKFECSCRASISSLRRDHNWNLPSSLCPCTDPEHPISISACLSSWKEYYQWRCLPLHSPVSILLHWPLTVYYCIQVAARQGLIPNIGDSLNIHYLGPEKEILQLLAFAELRALFPGVKLSMELIGPAVPKDGEIVHLHNYACCSEDGCPCKSPITSSGKEECGARVPKMMITFHKGFYHDIHRKKLKGSCPDLVIALNAGVAAYPSWYPTLELIKEMNVPAIFTDFCEEAAYLAARCITSVTSCSLRLPVQVNPFRQPMLVQDSSLYLPCYSNCFLFGM